MSKVRFGLLEARDVQEDVHAGHQVSTASTATSGDETLLPSAVRSLQASKLRLGYPASCGISSSLELHLHSENEFECSKSEPIICPSPRLAGGEKHVWTCPRLVHVHLPCSLGACVFSSDVHRIPLSVNVSVLYPTG